MNNKGQMQILELIIVAVVFVFGMYIYLNIRAPIEDNYLFPLLDNNNGTAPANAAVIKTMFQLIPLALVFMGFMYLMSYLNRPKEYPPAY